MIFYRRLLNLFVFLCEMAFSIKPRFERIHVFFNQVRVGGLIVIGELTQMELREGQQSVVTANLKTAAGHPAAYQDGTATFESSDPTIATVEQDSANPLQATVKGVDGSNNGSVVITFRADGDPDADQERDLVATLDVVVTQGEAVVADLEAGPASDIPAPGDGSAPVTE